MKKTGRCDSWLIRLAVAGIAVLGLSGVPGGASAAEVVQAAGISQE